MHSQIVYDPLGRTTSKQADGQAVFANAAFAAAAGQPVRPHAMKSAETVEGVFPSADQSVAYTSFDKVKAIAEGGNTLEYTYGYDKQRIGVVDTVDGVSHRKVYADLCEFVAVTDSLGSSTFSRTFIVGPYGVFAVVEKHGDEESIHYILKDHLGSWTTITDSEGNVEQEVSFDAWGNLRDPDTWQNYSVTEPSVPELVEGPMFDRGYTGHEHMTAFGLINMNGRCYDPLTSSFLSVDAYVQDPANAQAFNRYAYCGYNPLRYTDPTGWHYGPPGTNNAPNINPVGHTQWHSGDPNDVLLGRSVHPCRNSSSGYINGTAVTSTGYTQGNNSSISRGGVGGFYDQNGNYLGSNRYDNGKVYVLRSEIPEVMAMKDEILNFFDGETSSLSWNDIYNCFVEILPSRLGRSRMYDIVSQDDGSGGSAECNNMEYGGYIDEYGFPIETQHGDVKSPCVDKEITINFPYGMKYATFHSHPSGIGNCENYIGEDGKPYMPIWQQSPTKKDINVAGNHTCYVFGRRNDCVYVYTRQGAQTIIPTSVFISNSRFIKP